MAVDFLKEYWTWCEFKKHVASSCPLESARLFGEMLPNGTSKYFEQRLREAVIDLMQFVPAFNKNHETVYYPSDFVVDGEACVGALPPFAKVRSAWYYSTDKHRRFPVYEVPWEHRFRLTEHHHRREGMDDPRYITQTSASINAMEMVGMIDEGKRERRKEMSISPQHDQFYLHPNVTGEWVFSLFWDGNKLNFRDEEHIGMEEHEANAVAQWVQAQFGRYVEHDAQKYADCSREYQRQRTLIFLKEQAKGLIK